MFSELLVAIITAIIIGSIVIILLNLIFTSKTVVTDDRVEDKDKNFVKLLEETREPELKTEESVKLLSSDEIVEPKEFAEHSDDISHQNEVVLQTDNIILKNELIEDNSQPKQQIIIESIPQLEEEVIEDLIGVLDKEFDDLSDDKSLSDKSIVENEVKIEKPIDSELIEEKDFLNTAELQILTHFNKSRPKKHKSRASVKVVFSDYSSNDDSVEQITEDPISKNARELVENLFENLDSEVENYKNKTNFEDNLNTESEVLAEQQSGSDEEKLESDEKVDAKDETFEEISTGDYKKFDEFSDYFHAETQKQELSRKVCQMSSVSNFEITLDSTEQLTDDMIDKFIKDFGEKSKTVEVFEENYSKTTEFESIESRKEDKIEVLSSRSHENVLHTKRLSERSVSNTSLSKISLENLDSCLRLSKSPLSESIDNVTKPLLSSPTLKKKSVFESSGETEGENSANESPKRTTFPMFGLNQSSLMKEMKAKEFRKSLRSSNSLVDNKDSSDV